MKEPIDIEISKLKTDPDNDEIAIDFRWSDVQEENDEYIAEVKLIES